MVRTESEQMVRMDEADGQDAGLEGSRTEQIVRAYRRKSVLSTNR